MSPDDDQIRDGTDLSGLTERFGMDPAMRAEIVRILETEIAKYAPPAAEEHVLVTGAAVEKGIKPPSRVPLAALAQIPHPRPARELGPCHVQAGRVDHLSPLEHWSWELTGLSRAVLTSAWAGLPPTAREVWWERLLVARGYQRERQNRRGPAIGDSDS